MYSQSQCLPLKFILAGICVCVLFKIVSIEDKHMQSRVQKYNLIKRNCIIKELKCLKYRIDRIERESNSQT